jgi:hypothetical protein
MGLTPKRGKSNKGNTVGKRKIIYSKRISNFMKKNNYKIFFFVALGMSVDS